MKIQLLKSSICSLLLINILGSAPGYAAKPKPMDDQLATKLSEIEKLANANADDGYDFDKLQKANDNLVTFLKKVAIQKSVMNDPLNKAQKAGLSTYSSDDKKLRCYSWDTLTGGSMHNFYSMMVYESSNGILKCNVLSPDSSGEGGGGTTFEGLDTIKTSAGKNVYLVRDLFIGSGLIHGRNIYAYGIDNGRLSKVQFFQAGKKMLKQIDFDFAEYGDGTEFKLSADKKTLQVPLIKAAGPDSPGSGTATGKYLTYVFDGSKFVFKKK